MEPPIDADTRRHLCLVTILSAFLGGFDASDVS